MVNRIIVIGGSNGSIEIILKIISSLDKDFITPIIIVIHQIRNQPSSLIEILKRKTSIPVSEPEDKEIIKNNHIYIAPPNYHLLIEKDFTFSYTFSELRNFSRPSIDFSFETAADAFKKNVTGILLSGANSDGTDGIKKIKSLEGITIVQNPESAASKIMPLSAIKTNCVDFIFTPDEIINFINTNFT
ncbi:MAG TPA: chemotaxis protein CheB [Bacteroidetes bacterium]|nr:chemotaxis protein CheB [Ignavibacteria bacterium]HCA41648.1 chemotaxis protein CheB [Bacteroidota bacterium]HCN36926.1 chemotaxis protein CheB [Bacteroidota bacterium]